MTSVMHNEEAPLGEWVLDHRGRAPQVEASCGAEDVVPGGPCVSACGRLGVMSRARVLGSAWPACCWGKGVLAELSCLLCLRIPKVLPVQ